MKNKKQKKYDKDEGLARIKILLSNLHEKIGREDEDVNPLREVFIEEVDDILSNTKLSHTHIILERLRVEGENKYE